MKTEDPVHNEMQQMEPAASSQLSGIASDLCDKLPEIQVQRYAVQQRMVDLEAQVSAVDRQYNALYQKANQDDLQRIEEAELLQELKTTQKQKDTLEQEIFDFHHPEVGKLWSRLESQEAPTACVMQDEAHDDPMCSNFASVSCKLSEYKRQIPLEDKEVQELCASQEACVVEITALKEQLQLCGEEPDKADGFSEAAEVGAAELKEFEDQVAQAAIELRDFHGQWREAQEELAALRNENLEDRISQIEADLPSDIGVENRCMGNSGKQSRNQREDVDVENRGTGKTSGKQSQKPQGREDQVLRPRNKHNSEGPGDCKQQ